jgi:hypothetical protein
VLASGTPAHQIGRMDSARHPHEPPLGAPALDPGLGEPFDLATFGLTEMLRCGLALRAVARGAASMEGAARRIVDYLYDAARTPGGARQCALVRCFATIPYDRLGPSLQLTVRRGLGGATPDGALRCLTLLASNGDEAPWRSRHTSRAHRAIPLASAEVVRDAPMIAQLVQAFGVPIEAVVAPADSPRPLGDAAGKSYNVFHVEHASGSPYIPAQADFVVPYGIRSVLGFGGALPNGEIVAVIAFSRTTVPPASAARFRNIALDVKSALHPYASGPLFDPAPAPDVATS